MVRVIVGQRDFLCGVHNNMSSPILSYFSYLNTFLSLDHEEQSCGTYTLILFKIKLC